MPGNIPGRKRKHLYLNMQTVNEFDKERKKNALDPESVSLKILCKLMALLCYIHQ